MSTTELFPGFNDEQTRLLNLIKSKFPPSDNATTVWHYTTGQGLLAILEDGALWATQLSCLNDKSEYSYSSDLLYEGFLRKQGATGIPDCLFFLFQGVAKNMARKAVQPYSLKAPYYVTCFSEESDDLSQWRGYGGGENGFALGFDAKELNNRENLCRVFYPSDEAHVDLICEEICSLYCNGFSYGKPRDPAAWTDAFLWEIGWVFLELGTIIKHPSFKSENEFRQVFAYDPHQIADLRFRQKAGFLSRHLRVAYPDFLARTGRELPLTEIMIGPAEGQSVSEESISYLLRQKGYGHYVKIRRSPIPFREG